MVPTTASLLQHLASLRLQVQTASSIDEVVSVLTGQLVPALADGCAVILLDSGEVRRSAGIAIGDAGSLPPLPSGSSGRSQLLVWLHSVSDEAARGGGWSAFHLDGTDEVPSSIRVAIPITYLDGSAALVLARHTSGTPWTLPELFLAHECVRLAEFTMAATEQRHRTLQGRAAGDAAAHRWAAFARLSERLARSVDLADVTHAIMDAVVPYLADWVLLDIVSPGGELKRAGRRHADPGRGGLLDAIEHFPFPRRATRATIELLGPGGRLVAFESDEHRASTPGAEAAALADLEACSVAVVPIVAGGQYLGALTLATAESGQRYEPADLALFDSLAHQAALALNSAQLYHDAERARMEREEVLAIVSHDLKNPLNTMGFSLSILGQDGIADEKKAPQFGIMERALRQMDELVRNLLDAARIDAGQFSISPVPQDTRPLVREALLRAAPLAERARVRLEVQGLEEAPPVLADRNRLMQVFANLLDNAISFTPPDGSVALRVSAPEGAVRFEIEDSGPGLEPSAAEHVFDRFWQARHTGRAGTGLGLAIARGIIEAHDGQIGVSTEPGRGAVFHFSVPRAPLD